MNLKRYINTTRDKTGLGHSWGKGWPPGPWSEVLGHCHPGGSLEDNQGGRPDHNWWVESSSWCWGNYFHPSLSPGVLLKTVSASVPQVKHTISAPRAEHIWWFTPNRIWSKYSGNILRSKLRTSGNFYLMQTPILMKVHPVLSALLVF